MNNPLRKLNDWFDDLQPRTRVVFWIVIVLMDFQSAMNPADKFFGAPHWVDWVLVVLFLGMLLATTYEWGQKGCIACGTLKVQLCEEHFKEFKEQVYFKEDLGD
jgi:hypothetical protein